MEVVIIKYNAGNIQSVVNALQRQGVDAVVSDHAERIQKADKVIFPGVGEAGTAMDYLRSKGLDRVITELRQPVLGICLGLQLMCRHSEENNTDCLGIFDIDVKKFEPVLKVPHVGWNVLRPMQSALLEGLSEEPYVYYVHSYFAALSEHTVATTDYVCTFSAVLQKDNFYAVQAHPEKSGETGALILKNFLKQ